MDRSPAFSRINSRLFPNAFLWMAGSGRRWRGLPEHPGGWRSVKGRSYRWINVSVLDDVLAALAREADLEWLMIDSTIVCTHQHAAGPTQSQRGTDAGA
ncbi:transposase [Rhizobium tropici]|uniref:Transposase n=1 Tax=Rhizobium tropici TaxID=398 RepID=A0A5B0W0L7_RHITR|nr:transposase [Rhizobium tropici]